MNLGFYYNFFRSQVRCMSKKQRKDHYNSLGITPKSTQGEIKSAYYKLSKVHHPDKNLGNLDSAQKFRDITEAYEVLGNIRSRKLYDQGLSFGRTITEDDKVNTFHRSREMRDRPPHPKGRTPVYDFDEWTKSHYGATFKRQHINKQKSENYRARRQQEMLDAKTERVLFGLAIFLVISMLIMKNIIDYDDVEVEKPKRI